jgi:hypothetical protein
MVLGGFSAPAWLALLAAVATLVIGYRTVHRDVSKPWLALGTVVRAGVAHEGDRGVLSVMRCPLP